MNLVELLADAGLTGRGGAAFETARKIAAATRHTPLIVNACDGEIGAMKDAYVIAEHLRDVRYAASLLSDDVTFAAHRGSATEARLESAGTWVLPVPRRYVASEETALVSLAQGGLAKPFHKSSPVVHGVRNAHGRELSPSLVLNAETLWRIAQIVERGPKWFRSFGTQAQPGPRLVSISGAVEGPGVFHAHAGMRLAALLEVAGGRRVGAVNVGGMSGGWLDDSGAQRAIWSDEGLGPWGLRIGSGVLIATGRDECPLVAAARVAGYAAGESAGQCGPCMFGVPAVAAAFQQLAAGELERDELELMRERLALLPGRGACRFPDGLGGYLASALVTFEDEVRRHLTGRCSRSGVTAGMGASHV